LRELERRAVKRDEQGRQGEGGERERKEEANKLLGYVVFESHDSPNGAGKNSEG